MSLVPLCERLPPVLQVVNDTNNHQRMLRAAQSGRLSVIKECLLAKCDVNACVESEFREHTALSLACEQGHIDVCEYLLFEHSNVSLRRPPGSLTLVAMACSARMVSIVPELVRRGVDLCAMDAWGRNAFTMAVKHESTWKCVHELGTMIRHEIMASLDEWLPEELIEEVSDFVIYFEQPS